MALREELKKQGAWLFRWRSYMPLALMPLFVHAAVTFEYPGAIEETEDWGEIISLMIAFCGLIIRCLVIGFKPKNTSGRNTREQVAAVLNTSGMYSVVRHPLYLGNFIIWLGLSSFFRLWWLTTIVGLVYWIYYERIMFVEDEFLRNKFGEKYLSWTAQTPAVIPRISNWRIPDLEFSFKKIISQEYAGFYAIICSFTFFELVSRFVTDGSIKLDTRWMFIFSFGTVVYASIRFLVRHTSVLQANDR